MQLIPEVYRGYTITVDARLQPDSQWRGLYTAIESAPLDGYGGLIQGSTKGLFPTEHDAKSGALIAGMAAVDRLLSVDT
jgi:hypothetical protein